MKQWIAFALLVSAATPANAYLKVGSGAPDFAAQATLGGKEFTFRLSESLKRGPVVLYFYPAAFTTGCTIEAHNFAEAVPQFKMLNATVLGVSQDNIKTLDKFSVQECRSAFPVAADTDGAITKAYDARLSSLFAVSDRTSYVISPKGGHKPCAKHTVAVDHRQSRDVRTGLRGSLTGLCRAHRSKTEI